MAAPWTSVIKVRGRCRKSQWLELGAAATSICSASSAKIKGLSAACMRQLLPDKHHSPATAASYNALCLRPFAQLIYTPFVVPRTKGYATPKTSTSLHRLADKAIIFAPRDPREPAGLTFNVLR